MMSCVIAEKNYIFNIVDENTGARVQAWMSKDELKKLREDITRVLI